MQREPLITVVMTLLILNLFLANQISSVHSQSLSITVQTDKTTYNVGETVQISGNLTLDGSPVSQALVALQINVRSELYIIRTLYTETPPSGPWYVQVTDAYIGDGGGNPVSSVKRGAICYIWIYYENTWSEKLSISIAFTIYDLNHSPLFAQIPLSQSVAPGSYSVACAWRVPSDAELGAATIYASVFTASPKDGGTPYSLEKSSTFTIRDTTAASNSGELKATATQALSEGSFSNSFQLAKRNTRLGNYTVYVASFHQGYKTTSTTSFQVILLGDINGDLYINVKDAVLMGVAFGSRSGDPNWDPRCDLKQDGYINIKDAVVLGVNFGNSAI